MNEELVAVVAELFERAEWFAAVAHPDDRLLQWYQVQTGLHFPPDYVYLLRTVMSIRFGTVSLSWVTVDGHGPAELSTVLRQVRAMGVPHDWIPFARSDSGHFCLLPAGPIRLWADQGPTTDIWFDLATWVRHAWLDLAPE